MEQILDLPENKGGDFRFEILHQETNSRGELLLRTFFGWLYIVIPHLFVLCFVGMIAGILMVVSWFAVLILGRNPKGIFDYMVNYLHWTMRLNARLVNLIDGYPAFGFNVKDERVILQIPYPEKLSRGIHLLKTFLGGFYVLLPHGIILYIRFIASFILMFLAWFIVLFTGKYPEGMHAFITGTYRWALRVNLYMMFMTDTYPKFSGQP